MKIGTHNGPFHPDDVFAVAALLIRLGEEISIVRTRNVEELATCDILVDVGGIYNHIELKFDHHQRGGAGERPDGTKLSSFGLVWQEYGFEICRSEKIAADIERFLVLPIDARDNEQMPEQRSRDIPSIADVIVAMNPTWEESGSEDAAFFRAVVLAKDYLGRVIERGHATARAAAHVQEAIAQAKGTEMIVLRFALPWHQVIVTEAPNALFVVLPGNDGEWLVQGVPVALGSQQVRKRMPEAWGGLKGAELAAVTGVEDAKFAHNAGFIAVARSKEGALRLANLALAS